MTIPATPSKYSVTRHGQAVGAFTLIELLVVISIIAILIAMLLPALSKTRAIIQDAACKSKMKQVAMLADVYQTDWRYCLTWQMSHCDPALAGTAGGLLTWELGWSWAGQLLEGGYYGRRNEMLHPINAPSAKETYWESNLRKQSLFLCPSGKYFGRTSSVSFGAWSQRNWPAGVGMFQNDPASVDIVDYHIYHTIWPKWSVPIWGAKTANTSDYGLILSSYNLNGSTSEMVTVNGILGWRPLKRHPSNASPSTITLLNETSYFGARREIDMNNEEPFSPTIPFVAGNRLFRIPHGDKANYAAMDGSVGVVLRKHFGMAGATPTAAELAARPFSW